MDLSFRCRVALACSGGDAVVWLPDLGREGLRLVGGGPVFVRCGGQRDLHVESAVWPGVGLGVAAVCVGDRGDVGRPAFSGQLN